MAWCNCYYWYHKAHSPGRSRYEEYQLEKSINLDVKLDYKRQTKD